MVIGISSVKSDGWMDLHAIIKQPKTHFRVLYLPPNYVDYERASSLLERPRPRKDFYSVVGGHVPHHRVLSVKGIMGVLKNIMPILFYTHPPSEGQGLSHWIQLLEASPN